MRKPLLRVLRKLYHGIPIPLQRKLRIKSFMFSWLPFVFGNTVGYRNWQAVQRSLDWAAGTPAEPETASDHVPITSSPGVNTTIRAIAFYLPQFHPIPENDRWWGKGFTEWTNVTKAKPQFAGHYQPHLPGELGFYDLRLVEVQQRQIELAKMYGIYGFCYYHYWFGGKRLLERPFEQMLRHRELDFPFCICWANENWTRTWDGAESEVLIGQNNTPEDDISFIQDLEPALRDRRYIRVGGRPLIIVYRPALLPDPKATARRWRDYCRDVGLGEIFLAYTWAFEMMEPDKFGFDAAIEFPPNNVGAPVINDQLQGVNPQYKGVVYDYRYLVEESRHYGRPDFCLFRGVTPGWDNEARRPGWGSAFALSSPGGYAEWLENACRDTTERLDLGRRMVFINAWNEWAEGAHLEPDRRYGYAYLQATLDVLRRFQEGTPARRIVYVSHDAHPHGAQMLSVQILRTLKEVFHYEVDLILLGGGPLKADFSRYARVHDYGAQRTRRQELHSLLLRLHAEGARAAFVNTCASGMLVEPLKQAGFKVISLVHEMPGVIHERSLERRASRIAELADTVVFASPIVRDRFTEVTSVDEVRAAIRPQGLYLENPYRDQRDIARQRVHEEFRLPAAARIVLGVGFADRRKGIDLFAQVATQVIGRIADVVFIWLGNLEEQATAEASLILRSAGCEDRVLLPGPRKNPGIYYSAADVFLLTSREDPFPSVVLEAMDAGIPVVGFEGAGGFCDVLEDGAGVLVPSLDVEAMERAVLDLLHDPQRVQTLGARGQTLVEQRYRFVDYVWDLLRYAGETFRRLSVVVPNYNYARYLQQRLDSVFFQTYPIFELIVLDDASTDESVAVISHAIEGRPHDIRLLRNERNSGSVFGQWLAGVGEVRGDFVWIAEADDFAEPQFLERVMQGFDDPDVVLSYCQSRQVTEEGSLLSNDYLDYVGDVDKHRWRHDYCSDGQEEIQSSLAIKNTIPNVSAVVFRRTELARALEEEKVGLEKFKVAGDWVVYLNVVKHGKVRFAAQSLNNHRRHQSGVTLASDKLRHVREIAQVQRMVREGYVLDPGVAEKAAAFTQEVYTQFELATSEYPTFDSNPEIVSGLSEAGAAAKVGGPKTASCPIKAR